MATADRIIDLLHEARARPAGAEREQFLTAACGEDAALKEQIQSLLEADATEGEAEFQRISQMMRPRIMPSEKAGDRIGRYKLLEPIGEGGCGVVYVAEQEEPVRRRVALKVIKLGMDTRQVVARFEAERQALAMMDHPNIARIFDAGVTESPLPVAQVEGSGERASSLATRHLPLITSSGRPYFVMELVRGIKITDYCEEHQLPPRERLDLFIQVCRAIQHAHQKGIIHRDIKPSNILVASDDGVPVPKVIDFGIAKATQGRLTDQTVYTAFEQFIGTPAYMSPEQAAMTLQDVDTRSDIYSLGVLLYELLTGKTPFDAKELLAKGLDEMRRTIREVEPVKPSTRLTQEIKRTHERTLPRPVRHERGEGGGRGAAGATSENQTSASSPRHPPPSDGGEGESSQARQNSNSSIRNRHPSIPSDLDWIVMKCLEKDRRRRYETANGLAADIQRHLTNEPIIARPPNNLHRFQKAVQRNKLAFGAAAAVAIALFIGLAVSVAMGFKARHEAAKSRHVAQFLKDMLDRVASNAALERDSTLMREIADHTAENVRTELLDEPEVAIELELVLAKVYSDLLEFDKMADSAEQARRLASGSIGKVTQPYADATSFLARALLGLGRLEEAETMAREAIALQRRVRGSGNAKEADSLRCLGDALRGRERLPEAESAIEQSVAIFRQQLGNDASEVGWALNSLNIVLVNEGKYGEAERAIREAIAIRMRLPPGREQLALGWHYERLATTIMGSGATNRQSEAGEFLSKAIDIERQIAGEKYPALAWPHLKFARLLEQQARRSEAEAHFRAAAEVARSAQGMSKHQRAYFILQLGRFLGRAGRQQESAAAISESQALSSTPRL